MWKARLKIKFSKTRLTYSTITNMRSKLKFTRLNFHKKKKRGSNDQLNKSSTSNCVITGGILIKLMTREYPKKTDSLHIVIIKILREALSCIKTIMLANKLMIRKSFKINNSVSNSLSNWNNFTDKLGVIRESVHFVMNFLNLRT